MSLRNSLAAQWLGLDTFSLLRFSPCQSTKIPHAMRCRRKEKKQSLKTYCWLHDCSFACVWRDNGFRLIPFFIIRKDSNSERLKIEKWFLNHHYIFMIWIPISQWNFISILSHFSKLPYLQDRFIFVSQWEICS